MKQIVLVLLVLFSSLITTAQSQGNRIMSGKVVHTQTGSDATTFTVSCNFTDEAGLFDGTNVAEGDYLFVSDGGYGYYLPVDTVLTPGPVTVIVKVSKVGISLGAIPVGIGYISRGTSYMEAFPFVSGLSSADQQISMENMLHMVDSLLQYRLPARTVGGVPPGYTPTSKDSWIAQNGDGLIYYWDGDSWELPINGVFTDGPVTGSGTSFFPVTLLNNSITAAYIATNGVATAEILDGTVAKIDLAANSVDSTKISQGGVSMGDIFQAGATSGQVIKWNGTIWAPALDNDTGGGGGVPDGDKGDIDVTVGATVYTVDTFAITPIKLAADAVDSTKLATNSVQSSDIKDGQVWLSDLASNSVDSVKLKADAVQSSDIKNGQVWRIDIALDAIDSTRLSANSVQSSDIKDGQIWKNDLASNSVDSTKIVNRGISVFDLGQNGATSDQILKWNGNMWIPSNNSSAISDGDKTDIDVTGGGTIWTLDTGSVNTTKLADNAVDSTKLAANSVQSSDIKDGQVWKSDLAANSVDSTKISNGGISVFDFNQSGAVAGQVLEWNGNMWIPSTDNTGSTPALTSAHIFVGNGSNLATDVALTGNATISNTGVLNINSAQQYFAITDFYTSGVGSDQNNMNLNGSRMFFAPTASYNITGIDVGTNAGKFIYITNSSAFFITLKEENAGSLVVNRFKNGADYVIGPNKTITLIHNGSFWRVAGAAGYETIAGDITGRLDAVTVEKIRNKPLAAPVVGDDEKFIKYDHDTGTFVYAVGGGGSDNWGTQVVEKDATLTGTGVIGNVLGVAASAIDSTRLAANAVQSTDIANGQVWLQDLSSNSVDSSKIITGAVQSTDIATGQVWTQDLMDNAITNVKVADNAIGNAELIDNSVNTLEIVANAVTNAKLAVMNTMTFKVNNTGGSAVPIDGTVAQVKTMLDLSGSNSGDQTITLFGDIGGTGTGAITTNINDNSVSGSDISITGEQIGSMIHYDGANYVETVPNTTTTKKFLTQTGDGFDSAAPGWGVIAAADIPNASGGDVTGPLTNLQIVASAVTGTEVNAVLDLGGKTSLEIPNGATPVVDVDGEIALDNTVINFSHGLFRGFGTEEQFFITIPVANLPSVDGHVMRYNATTDEFEFAAPGTGADNWGSQVVEHGSTLTGTGVTGNLLDVATSGITNTQMADNAINTAEIVDGGVALADLAANSVDSSKLITGAVQSTDIATGQVWTQDLMDNAITNVKMADNAVGNAEMADNAIGTTEIINGSVALADQADMATGSFVYRKTAAAGPPEINTLATVKTDLGLAGNNNGDVTLAGQTYLSIAGQVITANAVNLSGTQVTGTLAEARIGGYSGEVTSSAGSYTLTIAASAVDSSNIATGAVQSTDIATGQVWTQDLMDNIITNVKVADNAINTAELANNSVTGAKIAMGSDATGDVPYYNGTDYARLAGNITATKQFLSQTGTGAVSAAPAWAALVVADIPSASGGDVTGPLSNLQIGSGTVAGTELAVGAVDLASTDVTGNLPEGNIANGTILARVADAETISGAWLFNATGNRFRDNAFTISDNGDNTKLAIFEASGITTATTRTYTLPNLDGTLALVSQLPASLYTASGTLFTNVLATLPASSYVRFRYSDNAIGLEIEDTGGTMYIKSKNLQQYLQLTASTANMRGQSVGFGTNAGFLANGTTAQMDYNSLHNIQITANGIICNSTSKFFHPPSMTTTERNTAAPSDAGILYNTTDLKFQFRQNGAWVELGGSGGYNAIQEDGGASLTQRAIINFVGTSYTATDDGTSKTLITADSDLDAIASNATNGIYARTGAGTVSARTLTGTTNKIVVTDGDGVAGNPTFNVGTDVVQLTSTQTLTNKTIALGSNTVSGTTAQFNTANTDGDFATLAGTEILTNKEVVKRVSTTASSATPTPTESTDDMYTVTALAVDATIGSPGAGANGQVLIVRIRDNGTTRAITWNAAFKFSAELPALANTVANAYHYLYFIYNTQSTTWDCVSKLTF